MQDFLTDAEAIARSGDSPERFAIVFDRHFQSIHGYVRRRVGPAFADDLTSETFAIAFSHRRSYDASRADARPWLLGIATNVLRHYWRQERRQLLAYARVGVDPVADSALEIDHVDERIDAQKAAPRVALALARLKRAERDVLLLHAWADLTYPEIADALGIPVGTVRSRLSRARRRLRELLDPIGKSD